MLRVPSVNPEKDRRIAKLEALLAELRAVPADLRGDDYLPWKEEFIEDRIEELRGNKGK